jgi:ABC-type transport system substrate-binding protein
MAFAAAMGVGTGCETPSAPPVSKEQRETPRSGGTFRLWNTAVSSLDPALCFDVATGNVIYQIFDCLVRFDTNLNPVPSLAESWRVSRDGLVYTFRLRPNVRFHDGSTLAADDVVYSLMRILDIARKTPTLAIDSLRLVDGVDARLAGDESVRVRIDAPDPLTVEIRLRQRAPYFLATLADMRFSILPQDTLRRMGDAEFGQRPVGTGPFKLESWENRNIRLARFENHFRGPSFLDAVEYRNSDLTEDTLPIRLLERGEIDLAIVQEKQPDERANSWRGPVMRHRNPGIYYLGFNVSLEPLDDPRVRRAISCAINRDTLVKADPNRVPAAATGFIPPGLRGYSPDAFIPRYDPAMAKRLLREAGFAEGEEIGPIPLWSLGGSKEEERIMADLRAVGIRTRQRIVHWFELQRALADGRVSMFVLGDLAFLPDAAPILDALFRSNGVSNFTRYASPEVDQLIDQALESYDSRRHLEICREIQTLVLSEMPCVPLFFDSEAFAVSPRVRDLELSPFGINHIHLGKTWLATE